MNYKFVDYSFNKNPVYSKVSYIWKDVRNGNYYMDDSGNQLPPFINYINRDYYREHLSESAKQITLVDVITGTIEFDGSTWKIDSKNICINELF